MNINWLLHLKKYKFYNSEYDSYTTLYLALFITILYILYLDDIKLPQSTVANIKMKFEAVLKMPNWPQILVNISNVNNKINKPRSLNINSNINEKLKSVFYK